jgi:hypothetical protein
MNDGRVVRVPIPELSEERRREMLKVARRIAEEARVAILHQAGIEKGVVRSAYVMAFMKVAVERRNAVFSQSSWAGPR